MLNRGIQREEEKRARVRPAYILPSLVPRALSLCLPNQVIAHTLDQCHILTLFFFFFLIPIVGFSQCTLLTEIFPTLPSASWLLVRIRIHL